MVTDLLDEVKYPAEAMLTTYQSRWGIETVFHQITDVFSLRHLIGTMPKAVLFQMLFCLLMYNAGMVQKRRFSGNTRNLSADPDRSRVGAGFRESLTAMLGLQFRENRVYPRSSSQ